MILGGQEVELRPLTIGEFLELLYMGSDILHDALVDWVSKGEKTSSFVDSLLTKLDIEDATKLICMFLHVEPEWLKEYSSAEESFAALGEAIKLNDWTEMLQMIVILDTIRLDEVLKLWQMVKVSSSDS